MIKIKIIAIVGFVLSAATMKAQTNINIERFSERISKGSPKFIDDIEILPDAKVLAVNAAAENDNQSPVLKLPLLGNIELCSALQFKYGMRMNSEVESITNFSLYNFIDKWWATRYHYGGTSLEGIDCSGFTGKLFLDVYNLIVPRTARDQYDICKKITITDLIEGDLVFFNTTGGISHVGLYLGNNYFVHSSVHGGVTINSLQDDYYSRKFVSGGRVE